MRFPKKTKLRGLSYQALMLISLILLITKHFCFFTVYLIEIFTVILLP
jgi:hypothetical protein